MDITMPADSITIYELKKTIFRLKQTKAQVMAREAILLSKTALSKIIKKHPS